MPRLLILGPGDLIPDTALPTNLKAGNLAEFIRDTINTMLASGAGVTLNKDDATDVTTITATGGDAELMRDTLGTALVGINGVQVIPNDAADTITISITGLTIAQISGLATALDGKEPALPVATNPTTQFLRGDKTWGTPSANTDMATKSGTWRQFADVSDVAPSDGVLYEYIAASNTMSPFDPDSRYAPIDPSTGRLAQSAEPLDFRPVKVLEADEVPPAGMRTSTMLFRKLASASLVPTLLGSNSARAVNNVVVTSGEALAVDDMIGITIGSTTLDGTVTVASYTVAYSTGAGAVTFATLSAPNATAAVQHGVARVTTAVPANATVTVTARDAGGVAITRVHLLAVAYRLPGIAKTSPMDQQQPGGGNASASPSAIGTAATPFDTVQASEIAIGGAMWNSLPAPADRTLAGTNGWVELAEIKSDNGASARSLWVGYKVLSVVQKPAFTTLMTSTEATLSTGQWAASEVTYKAA